MIVAIPAGPGLREFRTICERHGFMTFPHFIDNNWVAKQKPDILYLEKHLKRYGNGLVRFAVSPDNMPDEAKRLKKEWDVNWIYPLHSRDEDISDFEWIGFPHAEERRDYELSAFLKLTEEKKRWYLGYHDGRSPSDLLLFDAFDTTLPSTKAGRFGLLWMGWNQTKEVSHLNIPTYEIIEFNIISLKIALRELFLTRDTHLKLSEFNDPSFIFTEEDVKGMFSELCANSE